MNKCIECDYSKYADVNLGNKEWWPNKIFLRCVRCENKICNECFKKENGCLCKLCKEELNYD